MIEGTTPEDQWQVRVVYGFLLPTNSTWFTDKEREEFVKFDYDSFIESIVTQTEYINYYITDFEFKIDKECGKTTILIGVEICTLDVHYSGAMTIPSLKSVKEDYGKDFGEFIKDNPRFEHCPIGMHVYLDMRK